MSDLGAEIPFCGGAYTATDVLQDIQTCINWYPEVTENANSKEVIALLGTQGLNTVMTTQNAQVRGMWPLPGGQTAVIVSGNMAYLATITVPATQTSIAQFSTTSIGTLLTNSGPVCIRDNGVIFGGAGGYVVIVDGTYGYYYRISGPATVTFTATPSSGSATLAVSGLITAILPYLVSGASLSGTGIAGGTTIIGFDFNGQNITMSQAATSSPGAVTITAVIPQFSQITDTAFLPASRVIFIEGWLGFSQPGTRTFFTNAPIPYTLMFAGAFYALKDSSTDNLVTEFENNREYWLIGERTSEVWYNAGGAQFAFSRLPGVGPQVGCAATHSIARLGPNLAWLANNEQGENFVLITSQYSYERVSTHAIENAITSYTIVSDAIGFAWETKGHFFYVLTFPTADATWVYDLSSRLWHQWLSWDSTLGVYHRHRSNCFMNFANLRLVGDYQNGQVMQLSRAFLTDNGNVIRRQRRTPHVWSRQNRKRVFLSALQIEFTPGVGLSTGQGANPQAMLRWSNDGGFTWSSEHWTTIGATGATINRAIWRRLGRARDRVYELNFTDPVMADIIGSSLFGEPEEEGQEFA